MPVTIVDRHAASALLVESYVHQGKVIDYLCILTLYAGSEVTTCINTGHSQKRIQDLFASEQLTSKGNKQCILSRAAE